MSIKYRELSRDALELLKGPSFLIIFLLTTIAAIAVHHLHGTLLIWANVEVFHDIMNLLIGLLAGIVVTTYSITIVALQLASTQFSPRVIRHLLSQDLYTQLTLGTFLSWIIFCLIIKFWVLAPVDYQVPLEPQATLWVNIAVYGGIFLLAILLPHFILTIAQNINAAHIIRKIALHTLDVAMEEAQNWQSMEAALPPPASPDDHYVGVKQFGYLQEIHYQQIIRLLKKENNQIVFIEQLRSVGTFLTSDMPLFRYRLRNDLTTEQAQKLHKKIVRKLRSSYSVGRFRSFRQDIHFGVRQIVDIAIRAISPAINDPTTAINCLDYLGQLVQTLTQLNMPTDKVTRHKQVALYVNAISFDRIVNQAFDQIYHFGRHDYAIVSRTLSLLDTCVQKASNPHQLIILGEEIEEIVWDLLQQIEMKAIQPYVSQVQLIRLLGIAERATHRWIHTFHTSIHSKEAHELYEKMTQHSQQLLQHKQSLEE